MAATFKLLRNASYVQKEIQMTLKDDRRRSGFITCVIGGVYVEAKVYDEPSEYGINGGRVSKLAVMKTAMRDKNKAYMSQLCYNYDRGLDFSEISDEDLAVVVTALEKLPKVFID